MRVDSGGSDLVEAFEAIALGHPHVDELGVDGLDIGRHEQLFHGCVVAHVAVNFGIGLAPLLRGLPKKRNIEDISLVGIRDRGLPEAVTSGGMRFTLMASV